jgi:hypothetical protein
MIEFLCPNGHKIHCPEERAGLPAKCPRCGTRFLIPTLAEASAAVGTSSEAALPAETDATGIKARTPSSSGPQPDPPKEPQIEFLCPQGHHLHGPASLQGKPGECPECGSRFRIPTLQELVTPAPAEEEIRLEEAKTGRAPVAVDAAAAVPEPDNRDIPTAARAKPSGGDSLLALDLPPEAILGPPGVHPMAELFARFWTARTEGSRVEVHLASGGVLLPDGYVAAMSQHGHAVLVTRDPDGSHTVTLVPWDSVARVILRGIRQVPGEIVR